MKVFIFDLDDTIIYYPFNIINYNNISFDSNLFNLLDNLKYPKIIYTNGTYGHAEDILNNMNIINKFVAIYARDTMPAMKPHINSFKFVENDIRKHINEKNKYYFFEDRLENLEIAKSRGWNTIWVNINYMSAPIYVDYAFPNIHTAVMYFVIN